MSWLEQLKMKNTIGTINMDILKWVLIDPFVPEVMLFENSNRGATSTHRVMPWTHAQWGKNWFHLCKNRYATPQFWCLNDNWKKSYREKGYRKKNWNKVKEKYNCINKRIRIKIFNLISHHFPTAWRTIKWFRKEYNLGQCPNTNKMP